MNTGKYFVGSGICAAAVLASGLLPAHHSFAMFDRSKTVTVEGTVRVFEWSNPHLWLWINVPDGNGGSVAWGFEGVAPGEATRLNGWTKNTFTKGEKLTVEASPLKDGRNGGSLKKVTRADGTVVTRGGGPSAAGGPGGPPTGPPSGPPSGPPGSTTP